MNFGPHGYPCGDSRPFGKLRAGSRLSRGAKLRSLSKGRLPQSFNELRPVHLPGSLAG